MKKLLTIVILAASFIAARAADSYYYFPPTPTIERDLVPPTNAPPITGPLVEAINFLASGSNWIATPYGLYAPGFNADKSAAYGGGLAMSYLVNQFTRPTARFEWFNGGVSFVSAQAQFQLPVKLGSVWLAPNTYAGFGTPMSGYGNDNGSVYALYGVGMEAKLTDHFYLGGGVEWRSGANLPNKPIYVFAISYHF